MIQVILALQTVLCVRKLALLIRGHLHMMKKENASMWAKEV